MQRLIYTVDIDEEIYGADFLLEAIDETIKAEIGCEVLKSRLESDVDIIENGEWESVENCRACRQRREKGNARD